VLTTLRKGLTKLETAGYAAGSLVQHPLDWKDVELARASSNAVEHLSLPDDPATRRLFEVSAMATVGEAAGVGHVPARDTVVVDTDSLSVGVQWSENSNADDFSKNLIRDPLRGAVLVRACYPCWAWCERRNARTARKSRRPSHRASARRADRRTGRRVGRHDRVTRCRRNISATDTGLDMRPA